MDTIFWRLIYDDDSYEDELIGNSSILSVKRGAVCLMLCYQPPDDILIRKPFVRVEIEKDWRPIFYRRRVFNLNPNIDNEKLTKIVFGKALNNGEGGKSNLWTIENSKIINCPEELIDFQMIVHQTTE